jgi:hypothetical protein
MCSKLVHLFAKRLQPTENSDVKSAEHVMKQHKFSPFCLTVTLTALVGVGVAAGQANLPVAPNGASRPVVSRSAPVAKPIASTPIAPHAVPRAIGMTQRTIASYPPRVATQPATNLRPNYSPGVRGLNPTLVALNVQRNARSIEKEPITLDPRTRQSELRTLAAMRARQRFGPQNRTAATTNPQQHFRTEDPAIRRQPQTHESPENTARKHWHNKKDHRSYADAFRCHWHEWHDRQWWHNNCDTIVFVSTGYYFLDGSYWYPAWGYDPLQTYNDYDGPIYTYGDLLPDEVIANVQTTLQDAGYYSGPITGSLNGETRAALANFQRDYGLPITGAIDEPTVETLGLYQTDETDNFQTDQGY